MSAGAFLGHLLGEGVSFGLGYGALTVGNRDKNLTLGAGWAFADSEWANSPTLTLSGMTRVGRKTYLLTENGFEAYVLKEGLNSVDNDLLVS